MKLPKFESSPRLRVAGFLILALGCGYAVIQSGNAADDAANTSTAQHKADQAQIVQLKVQATRDAQLARDAFVTQCENANDVRAGVTGYVASVLVRSKRALDATLASPTATDQQKLSALINYAGTSNANEGLSHRLAQKPCAYPPAKPKPGGLKGPSPADAG